MSVSFHIQIPPWLFFFLLWQRSSSVNWLLLASMATAPPDSHPFTPHQIIPWTPTDPFNPLATPYLSKCSSAWKRGNPSFYFTLQNKIRKQQGIYTFSTTFSRKVSRQGAQWLAEKHTEGWFKDNEESNLWVKNVLYLKAVTNMWLRGIWQKKKRNKFKMYFY